MNEKVVEQAGFSIGVVARMTGISAHTLRMWERRYQLGPSKRSAGGQREYNSTDIDHLRLIKQLTSRGMRIGDIAQLPMKTLSSLVHESGEVPVKTSVEEPIRTQVVGVTACNYFKNHIKRYPRLAIELSPMDIDQWLVHKDSHQCNLAVLQFSTLSRKYSEIVAEISMQKVHVVVVCHYVQPDIEDMLTRVGITVLRGGIDELRIDEAINKVLAVEKNLSAFEQSQQKYNLPLPSTQPRQFEERQLLEIEMLEDKLNCKCPTHLSDLVRRLGAFEEYSKTCGSDNWQEAAIHACVYSYTNQARFFIEKALRAVLDE